MVLQINFLDNTLNFFITTIIITSIITILLSKFFIEYITKRTSNSRSVNDYNIFSSLKILFPLFLVIPGLNYSIRKFSMYIQYSNYINLFSITIILIVFILNIDRIIRLFFVNKLIRNNVKQSNIRKLLFLGRILVIDIASMVLLFYLIYYSKFIGYSLGNWIIIIEIICLIILTTIIILLNQDMIKNFSQGFLIQVSGIIKNGDIIKLLPTGEILEVVSVESLITEFRNRNDEIVQIPNNNLINDYNIVNYSDKKYTISFEYNNKHEFTYEKIRKAFTQATINTTNILEKPKPFVVLKDFENEKEIYELFAYTNKFSNINKIESNLKVNFIKNIRKLGTK